MKEPKPVAIKVDPERLKIAFEQYRRTMQAEFICQTTGCTWEQAVKQVRGEQ
jgi:hypothetical protein